MGEPKNLKGYMSNPSNALGSVQRKSPGVTEQGQSPFLSASLLSRESEIRSKSDELAYVYDSDGNEIIHFQGNGGEVYIDKSKVPENAIITHNHPYSLGETGILAIGHSFSVDDIRQAVETNASEIRAVTPTYTYSLKRPAGGWGMTPTQAVRRFNKIYRSKVDELIKYRDNHDDETLAVNRANTVADHAVVREFAKNYGLQYSKKRG